MLSGFYRAGCRRLNEKCNERLLPCLGVTLEEIVKGDFEPFFFLHTLDTDSYFENRYFLKKKPVLGL